MSYEHFFKEMCGFAPYRFQVRFRESMKQHRALMAPTGLGKTMTVLADWLDRNETTRLVYCLPGRALTQQVAEVIRTMMPDVRVIELMGGSDDLDIKLQPQERTVLVGTQDILVSRALNRGYARSPFRWPVDFGLLNNDTTWVFDELQLLGEALATSTQLAAFRADMKTFGKVPCVWMSATFDRSWLDTVNFREDVDVIELDEQDEQDRQVKQRLQASKLLRETEACTTPRDCAEFVAREHKPDSLTIVIANTVVRAQEIWDGLRNLGEKPVLLHSRFRPADRKHVLPNTGILVSTQVIEAGVDIDAELMVTDVAPWASLVQRFGRVNRKGTGKGRIYWVRSPQWGKKPRTGADLNAPYKATEVMQAIEVLQQLNSAAPADLRNKVKLPAPYRFVLRRSDILDLFDTTPDLTGNYIDVSRFVRSGEETNVYIAWRKWVAEQDPPRVRLQRNELCPVPHFPGDRSPIREFLKSTKAAAWTWNYVGRGKWERVDPDRGLYSGMQLLLRSEAGGYDLERGWAPESKQHVSDIGCKAREEASTDSDPESDCPPETLEQHTDAVVRELESILGLLRDVGLNGAREAALTAARFHDWGKAHPVFQQTLHDREEPFEQAPDTLLAKSRSHRKHSRKHFRHELASALAMLGDGREFLEAYLAAAHHGKVRVSIRSMPGEVVLKKATARIARGIEAGDQLFAAGLGSGAQQPETELDLSITELGTCGGVPGWSDRVLDLLDEHGPFRLAYLEMLLRVADEEASRKGEAKE